MGFKTNEINLVTELQKCGVWNDLIAATNLVAYHVNSLIHYVNNNCVEGYNNIVAKFIGKRINFSLRGNLVFVFFFRFIKVMGRTLIIDIESNSNIFKF